MRQQTDKEFRKPAKGARRSAFPERVEPMLATRISQPFDDGNWIYEIKWDGYRIIAYSENHKPRLLSRGALNYTKEFSVISEAIASIPHNMILDGEVIAVNSDGLPDFELLQNYQKIGSSRLRYYVFDILWLDGYALMHLPLIKRKQILQSILPKDNILIYCEHIEEEGKRLFDMVSSQGMEGIVAKKADSMYEPGKRVNTWLKIPTEIRQDFVIGGWTESESRPFKSLLFGAYRDGKLYYIGHAGGGFKDKQMKLIIEKLKKLERKKKPFVNDIDTDRKVHWIKPELVAEIKYATWTKAGKIRKPAIFLRFRNDMEPESVSLEAENIPATDRNEKATKSNWPLIEKEPVTSENELMIDKRTITLINIEKVLWKPFQFTKADLINYYLQVQELILPYIIDRPQSMHIKPDGPFEKGFYIKDMEGHGPDWLKTFPVRRIKPVKGKRSIIDYLVCNDLSSLLYMINLGCIDVNPWLSRTAFPDKPEFCFIDLDPSGNRYEKVFEAALVVKEVLDKMRVASFIKTSGKTGMHICIPLGAEYSYKESLSFAEVIAEHALTQASSLVTLNRNVSQRRGKVYIDCYQNIKGQTMAAPYCIRPYNSPVVSVPLEWSDLNQTFTDHHFLPDVVLERISTKGFKDPFKGVLGPAIDMREALLKL